MLERRKQDKDLHTHIERERRSHRQRAVRREGAAELALFPTRVVPLGATRSAYSFTMFKAPGTPDELFESQYESLRREFGNIRARFAGEHASCAR
jgi:hypothetical protein